MYASTMNASIMNAMRVVVCMHAYAAGGIRILMHACNMNAHTCCMHDYELQMLIHVAMFTRKPHPHTCTHISTEIGVFHMHSLNPFTDCFTSYYIDACSTPRHPHTPWNTHSHTHTRVCTCVCVCLCGGGGCGRGRGELAQDIQEINRHT